MKTDPKWSKFTIQQHSFDVLGFKGNELPLRFVFVLFLFCFFLGGGGGSCVLQKGLRCVYEIFDKPENDMLKGT